MVGVFALVPVAASVAATTASPDPSVGAQYDSTHVYLAPRDVNRFVASFIATFGGTATKSVATTVTPTASRTTSRLVLTPCGTLSVFGFTTPVPYPFGSERTGYLVRDMDAAVAAARAAGAAIVVAPFPDPIGRDTVVQWPGGVGMQLYWHTIAPAYPRLKHVPENRVYLSPDSVAAFVASFTAFAHGHVVSDASDAPGAEIARPGETYRRIHISSGFGAMVVIVSDGHLPYPYGRELTGYGVDDLTATLAKATASGATILVPPHASDGRVAAMVAFPGGYVVEVHAPAPK